LDGIIDEQGILPKLRNRGVVAHGEDNERIDYQADKKGRIDSENTLHGEIDRTDEGSKLPLLEGAKKHSTAQNEENGDCGLAVPYAENHFINRPVSAGNIPDITGKYPLDLAGVELKH
jgi:hypothetical protein